MAAAATAVGGHHIPRRIERDLEAARRTAFMSTHGHINTMLHDDPSAALP